MRSLVSLALLVLLSACQPTVDTRIASSGTGLSEPGTYGLGDAAGALDADLARKVTDRLAQMGYRAGDIPAYQLDISASQGPATAKVVGASAEKQPKARAQPWFRKCTPTTYRFAVLLTDVTDGNLVYRGEASEEHCVAGDKSVFPYLADASLKDLASPQGVRIEKRSVRR